MKKQRTTALFFSLATLFLLSLGCGEMNFTRLDKANEAASELASDVPIDVSNTNETGDLVINLVEEEKEVEGKLLMSANLVNIKQNYTIEQSWITATLTNNASPNSSTSFTFNPSANNVSFMARQQAPGTYTLAVRVFSNADLANANLVWTSSNPNNIDPTVTIEASKLTETICKLYANYTNNISGDDAIFVDTVPRGDVITALEYNNRYPIFKSVQVSSTIVDAGTQSLVAYQNAPFIMSTSVQDSDAGDQVSIEYKVNGATYNPSASIPTASGSTTTYPATFTLTPGVPPFRAVGAVNTIDVIIKDNNSRPLSSKFTFNLIIR